jgi:hypothetical protein
MTEKTFDEEVMEVIDDAERLSNEEWTSKYGDRTYLEVLKSLILSRIESCPKLTTSAIIKVVDGECKTIRTYAIPESDIHRVFGVEGKQKRR